MADSPSRDPTFVHLRMHSEYSISDGIVRLDAAVAAAAADEQPALALTDLANVFGLIRFYKAARGAGIKPIAGCDIWVQHRDVGSAPVTGRALLLARNRSGYLALCELLSRAYLENAAHGRAELRFEWFDDVDTSGLIALSGAHAGDVGSALATGRRAQAVAHATRWAERFPGAYYLELQRYGQPDAESHIDAATSLAAELALPVVATHPIQFLTRGEFVAHEARTCIAEGEMLANPRRQRRFTAEQYLKTQARDGRAVRRHPVGARQRRRDREALQPAARARPAAAAAVPDAGRADARRAPRCAKPRPASRIGCVASIPTRSCARASGRAMPNDSRSRPGRSRRWASPATS